MTELTCETPHSPPDCKFAVWSFQPPAGSLIDELQKNQSPKSGLAQEVVSVIKGGVSPGTFAHELPVLTIQSGETVPITGKVSAWDCHCIGDSVTDLVTSNQEDNSE